MKYQLTEETLLAPNGATLRRIKYLRDIPAYGVKAGDTGGWIEKEDNLSQGGDCVVLQDARVYGSARVDGNARVSDNAWVYGSAVVGGTARVFGNAEVFSHLAIAFGTAGGHNWTAWRNADTSLTLQYGCETHTVEEWKDLHVALSVKHMGQKANARVTRNCAAAAKLLPPLPKKEKKLDAEQWIPVGERLPELEATP